MTALSKLITKVTKRQFQIARDVNELSNVLDRTIAFATAENPFIGEDELNELLPYIPVTEPEEAPEEQPEQ
jgi:hypothetical protein